MKITLFALFAGLLMLGGFGYGSAEDKPDLSNTASPKDPIKSAVESAKLEDRNGYKYLPNTEKPYSGWAKETYDNGQVKSLTQFKEGNVVLATSWHENGGKQSEGNYTSGKEDGLWTWWHENGQKKWEVNCKNGKNDGLVTVWSENGQKKAEQNYKDDKRDGLYTVWYENGQKKEEANFKDDKKDGLVTLWHENGQKLSEGNYKDSKEID